MCVREGGREERGIENVWEIDHSPPYMNSREEREPGSEIGFCKCVYVRLRERERESVSTTATTTTFFFESLEQKMSNERVSQSEGF